MASTGLITTFTSSFCVFSKTHSSFPLTGRALRKFQRKHHLYATPLEQKSSAGEGSQKKNLRILVVGGGIGGLVFALAAKRKGFQVTVFEKDVSAIMGEGKYRGPIQIQSNALAALEAIDLHVADHHGC